MKFKQFLLHSFNNDIPAISIQHETQSKKLAIFLPGAGYTNQAPLLKYTTTIYINHGFDILQINYHDLIKQVERKEFNEIIHEAVQSFLKEYNYESLHFVTKSIGTLVLSHLLSQNQYADINVIWFTPLLTIDEVYQSLSAKSNPGLVFIGDKDPVYEGERFNQLQSVEHLSTYLVEGTDHSLEIEDDVFSSLEILQGILKSVDDFVR